MNRRMFVPTAIFVMLFSLLCVVSAEAHFLSIFPDTKIHKVAVGSTYELAAQMIADTQSQCRVGRSRDNLQFAYACHDDAFIIL